jgi:hypothetical protein
LDSAIDTVIGEIIRRDCRQFDDDNTPLTSAKNQLETFAKWSALEDASTRRAAVRTLDRLEALACGPLGLECIDMLEKPFSYKIRYESERSWKRAEFHYY